MEKTEILLHPIPLKDEPLFHYIPWKQITGRILINSTKTVSNLVLVFVGKNIFRIAFVRDVDNNVSFAIFISWYKRKRLGIRQPTFRIYLDPSSGVHNHKDTCKFEEWLLLMKN